MSKSGFPLRQKKDQKSTYTFTHAQLKEHDAAVIANYAKSREDYDRHEEAKSQAHIDKAWEENASAVMRFWLSVSCRILIEEFGWKPPRAKGRNTNIMRYADILIDHVNSISHTKRGFSDYAAETNRLYGIEFGLERDDA